MKLFVFFENNFLCIYSSFEYRFNENCNKSSSFSISLEPKQLQQHTYWSTFILAIFGLWRSEMVHFWQKLSIDFNYDHNTFSIHSVGEKVRTNLEWKEWCPILTPRPQARTRHSLSPTKHRCWHRPTARRRRCRTLAPCTGPAARTWTRGRLPTTPSPDDTKLTVKLWVSIWCLIKHWENLLNT